jgi:hypothetical protein
MNTLDTLLAQGFDNSTHDGRKQWRVCCSQCAALVINGVPAHEHGCPNRTHACKGCDARIPARQRYCEDCA